MPNYGKQCGFDNDPVKQCQITGSSAALTTTRSSSAKLREAVRLCPFSNITPEGDTIIFCSFFFAALRINLLWYTRIKISSSPKRKAAESESDNAKRSPVLIYVNSPSTKMMEAAQRHASSAGREVEKGITL